MSSQTQQAARPSNEEIMRLLARGLGHEHVTDENVGELIELAKATGHPVVEEELREWKSAC